MPKLYAERIEGVIRKKSTSVRFTPQETFFLEVLALRGNISTSAYLAKLVQKAFNVEKKKIFAENKNIDDNFFEFVNLNEPARLIKKFYLCDNLPDKDRKIMDYILDCKNCLTMQGKEVVIDKSYVIANFKNIKEHALEKTIKTELPKNTNHDAKPVLKTLKGKNRTEITLKVGAKKSNAKRTT
jgi:hypothetical protein